ncbi:MAG: sensor histidine kinase, partial [Methyloligellaceae bacterium]
NRLRDLRNEAIGHSRAKSQFLANMSHELQTPLNAVLGFSEVLSKEIYGPLGDPRYAEYAEDIHEGGQHLLGIVRDLLNLSKIEAGAFEIDEEDVDVKLCVEGSLRMVKQQAKRAKLTLSASGADVPCKLQADKRLVRQMLLNLLSNAVKFTPAGGRVTTEVKLRRNKWLTIAVSDTGHGIAAHDIPKVLEPFGRVNGDRVRDEQSTGLGLALVKSMMQLHGGFLQLESTLGEGTKASLHFPPDRVSVESMEDQGDQKSPAWLA